MLGYKVLFLPDHQETLEEIKNRKLIGFQMKYTVSPTTIIIEYLKHTVKTRPVTKLFWSLVALANELDFLPYTTLLGSA